MAKTSLVIVESPAKAKTIGKYLGPNYQVKACMGHLRDLPKSTFLKAQFCVRSCQRHNESTWMSAMFSLQWIHVKKLESICVCVF